MSGGDILGENGITEIGSCIIAMFREEPGIGFCAISGRLSPEPANGFCAIVMSQVEISRCEWPFPAAPPIPSSALAAAAEAALSPLESSLFLPRPITKPAIHKHKRSRAPSNAPIKIGASSPGSSSTTGFLLPESPIFGGLLAVSSTGTTTPLSPLPPTSSGAGAPDGPVPGEPGGPGVVRLLSGEEGGCPELVGGIPGMDDGTSGGVPEGVVPRGP